MQVLVKSSYFEFSFFQNEAKVSFPSRSFFTVIGPLWCVKGQRFNQLPGNFLERYVSLLLYTLYILQSYSSL